jgi:conjugative transfer signal peptidase TraF
MSKRGCDLPPANSAVALMPGRRRRRRSAVFAGAAALAALALPVLLKPPPRLVWNASASVPIGLYWVAPQEPVQRGDLVLATLPRTTRRLAAERGYLPAGVPVVKRVAAIADDRVCAIGPDVWIDGRAVARALSTDRLGRPLPHWTGCRTLGANEIFLFVEGVPDSFDGRYFGPIGTDHVIGRLVPLWTR